MLLGAQPFLQIRHRGIQSMSASNWETDLSHDLNYFYSEEVAYILEKNVNTDVTNL